MKTVEIKAGKKEGTQLVLVTAENDKITAEQVNEALGNTKNRFKLQKWSAAGAGGEKKEKKEKAS